MGFLRHKMRYMGLRLYLMGLIFVIAVVCLLTTAAYFLYQANQESHDEIIKKADSMSKHLELQLLLVNSGYDASPHFPDLSLGAKNKKITGLCLQYRQLNGNILRRACYGSPVILQNWPEWFDRLYRRAFHPEEEIVRTIAYKNKSYGTLTLSPDANLEISRAWVDVLKLLSLFAVTLSALSIMLYFFVGRALKPADVIISGVERMTQGDLATRLPDFRLMAWQRIGNAINQLSASLDKTLAQRHVLTVKLMNVQEEERRLLTRDLHDEFGQCLAGQQATAFSMTKIASEKCPELVADCQHIADINSLMMAHLRNMLLQLNPSNIDELGLSTSLTNLVCSWNRRSGGKIHYSIELDDNIDQLPAPIPNHLFRIVQECLTNVAKHSEAKTAHIILERTSIANGGSKQQAGDSISVTITDDGHIDDIVHLGSNNGMGLPGIRERITALGGNLTLRVNQPTGLIVQLRIPILTMAAAQNDTA